MPNSTEVWEGKLIRKASVLTGAIKHVFILTSPLAVDNFF